ncbi:uncharacterized protein LOC128394514 [Panonychus citri]|uniref:uncharacterized protein LOC128394514 n=1 Tax=Panonychus citri TaxID=50023 RepID=UPI0023076E48|nr:uncharacterized protein LOC128394514 [Panonychus citri]
MNNQLIVRQFTGSMLILIFATQLIIINPVNCDGKKNKFRGNRPKGNCHLKEIHECIEKIDHYSNDPEAYKLITSDSGIDQICSNSQDVIYCFKDHMEKCATPIQNELFDFVIEHFGKQIDRFCKPGQLRQDFLAHSPCIADSVLSKSDYKEKCNQPYLASIDTINKSTQFDDRLDLTCCSYRRWINCLLEMTSNSCKDSGKQAMNNFLDKSFAGLSSLICSQDQFDPTSDRCKSLYPTGGASIDPNQAHNPLTKYITTYFRFLLTK